MSVPSSKKVAPKGTGTLRIKVDPLASPLIPPSSTMLPRGGSFVRDHTFGAGEVSHQEKTKSLLRRAGIR